MKGRRVPCARCGRLMHSGFGKRFCRKCRTSAAWVRWRVTGACIDCHILAGPRFLTKRLIDGRCEDCRTAHERKSLREETAR